MRVEEVPAGVKAGWMLELGKMCQHGAVKVARGSESGKSWEALSEKQITHTIRQYTPEYRHIQSRLI